MKLKPLILVIIGLVIVSAATAVILEELDDEPVAQGQGIQAPSDLTDNSTEQNPSPTRLETNEQDNPEQDTLAGASTYNSPSELQELRQQLSQLQAERQELNQLLINSILPPYTTIRDDTIISVLTLSDGDHLEFSNPIHTFYDEMDYQFLLAQGLQEYEYIPLNLDGKPYRSIDMTPFVNPGPFREPMQELSALYPDDERLIHEIWHLVTSANTYRRDIGEDPQGPFETLVSGNGDCEDSSILIASLLLATGRDWDVSFIYTDYDHPSNPQAINHILLEVNTGADTFIVETTNEDEINPHGTVEGIRKLIE